MPSDVALTHYGQIKHIIGAYLQGKKKKTLILCACVRACVRACVCVCMLNNSETGITASVLKQYPNT